MDEPVHPAEPEPTGPPAPGVTSPNTVPAAEQPERRRRAETVRKALVSRVAGWVVAAVLAGAVVALSIVLATGSATPVVQRVGISLPARLAPLGGQVTLPQRVRLRPIPPGVQIVVPPGAQIQVIPAGTQIQVIPAGPTATPSSTH